MLPSTPPKPEDKTTDLAPRYLSPRHGKPVRRRDAERLRDYAIQNGGRIELNESTLDELERKWNVRRNRIAACVCNLRQFYGIDFIAERDGRKVKAYVMQDV